MNPETVFDDYTTGTRAPLPFPKIMKYGHASGRHSILFVMEDNLAYVLESPIEPLGKKINPSNNIPSSDYEGEIHPEWLPVICKLTDISKLSYIVSEEEYKSRRGVTVKVEKTESPVIESKWK